jgi:hypothetical protein
MGDLRRAGLRRSASALDARKGQPMPRGLTFYCRWHPDVQRLVLEAMEPGKKQTTRKAGQGHLGALHPDTVSISV